MKVKRVNGFYHKKPNSIDKFYTEYTTSKLNVYTYNFLICHYLQVSL